MYSYLNPVDFLNKIDITALQSELKQAEQHGEDVKASELKEQITFLKGVITNSNEMRSFVLFQ